MKVLIADDDPVHRLMLKAALTGWGYEVVETDDGAEALRLLLRPDGPKLALLDWGMPGMDGLEICRRIREHPSQEPPYLILLTAHDTKADVVTGLRNGANEYIIKPFDSDDLRARIGVGRRVVELQAALSARVRELEEAMAHVKQLRELLPICCYCKKVRDDQNYWEQVDSYLLRHSEIRFTHGICPDCLKREMDAFEQSNRTSHDG